METTILLQGISPDQLTNQITTQITEQLNQFKKELQNQPNAEELLTRKEACKLLQIDSSALWNWTNKGRVTAYGIANRRYYKRSELMKSLKPLNTQRHEQ